MRLKRFRIENYKSILDSGWCYLSSDITIFAGQNESGKTSILEAIYSYQHGGEIQDNDKPIGHRDNFKLTLHFDVEKKEIKSNETLNKYLKKAEIEQIVKNGVYVFRDQEGEYGYDENTISVIVNASERSVITQHKEIPNWESKVISESIQFENKTENEIFGQIQSVIGRLRNFKNNNDNTKDTENTNKEIIYLKQILEEFRSNDSDNLFYELHTLTPKIVFFDSFNDNLPRAEKLTTVQEFVDDKKSNLIKDFIRVLGLDVDELINLNDEERIQDRDLLLSEHTGEINSQFERDWVQEKINLLVEFDGDKIRFFAKQKSSLKKLYVDQHSKGFQWFLCFYLRLKAEGMGEGNNRNILLIDEPGLFLHAKAQNDVLNVLENLSKNNQIIISTHSPYLIDPLRLDRIKLVEKKEDYTTVYDKFHSHKLATQDTLTPIITAVGLDLAKQFAGLGSNNLIVEGISDYNYLLSMDEYIGRNYLEGISVVPPRGADHISSIVSLLIGWGFEYKILLDNDRKGRSVKKYLINDLCVDESSIILVSPEDNKTIESIFDEDDYSANVKKGNVGKFLQSKIFFDDVVRGEKQGKLNEKTLANFETLLKTIQEAFKK